MIGSQITGCGGIVYRTLVSGDPAMPGIEEKA
jgi:hypothetical protein